MISEKNRLIFRGGFYFGKKCATLRVVKHKQGASMKYLRYTLLMILTMALVIPPPSVWAESGDTVVENTAVVDNKPGLIPKPSDESREDKPAPPEASDAGIKIHQPNDSPAVKKGDVGTLPANTVADKPTVTPADLPENDADTVSEIVISKIRLSPASDKYVELYNPSNRAVNLAKWKLEYIASSGKVRILSEFTNGQLIAPGGFLVIKDVKSTKGYDIKSDANWQSVLSKTSGAVRLLRPNATKSDTIGWGKEAKDFEKRVAAGNKEILWRCFTGGVVVDSNDNADDLAGNDDTLIEPRTKPSCPKESDPPVVDPANPDPPLNRCDGLGLSEIGANLDEQFIEIVNVKNQDTSISGCKLATNRTKKPDVFGDTKLRAGEYLKVDVKSAKLMLSKRSRGEVYLLDSAGNEIDTVAYESMPDNSSWGLIGSEWMKTYAPTPGGKNVFKEFADCKPGYVRNEITGKCNKIPAPAALPAPCPAGQYRHPETGRCRKIAVAKTVTPCKEGYYRSEATGRCRSIASAAAKTLKPCPDGQFRNPATGRCKKIASADDVLKECPEGFERNPKTRRCRKIAKKSAPAAAFAPENIKQVAGATWGWWAFGGISSLAAGYGAWQWRWEVSQIGRKIRKFVSRGK